MPHVTAPAALHDAATPRRGMLARRRVSRLEWLALGAGAVASAHLLVDAATGTGSASARVLETAVALAVVPVTCGLYLASPRVVRALLLAVAGAVALSFGIGWYAAGAFYSHRPADVTGTAVGVAGAFLLAAALVIAVRGRRRLVQVPAAIAAVVLIAQWVSLPAVTTTLATHAPRASLAPARSLGLAGAVDVAIRASDGVELRGWYVPSRNRAAIVVLHGSHGNRTSTLPVLRFLARAGYGVLAYDARGHGESGGGANALGWRGGDDAVSAVAYLRRRPDVDPGRIALFGLSMGGEEALRAGGRTSVGAIVADGAGASTLGDQRLVSHGAFTAIFVSSTWIAMREVALASGIDEPPPLARVVRRITAPTLLIASHAPHERAVDEAYRVRIGANASLWYVADAGHTQALRAHPRAYVARTLGFLERALRPSG
jgi:pimeloyl-ACP methyl ester carboxylesterase